MESRLHRRCHCHGGPPTPRTPHTSNPPSPQTTPHTTHPPTPRQTPTWNYIELSRCDRAALALISNFLYQDRFGCGRVSFSTKTFPIVLVIYKEQRTGLHVFGSVTSVSKLVRRKSRPVYLSFLASDKFQQKWISAVVSFGEKDQNQHTARKNSKNVSIGSKSKHQLAFPKVNTTWRKAKIERKSPNLFCGLFLFCSTEKDLLLLGTSSKHWNSSGVYWHVMTQRLQTFQKCKTFWQFSPERCCSVLEGSSDVQQSSVGFSGKKPSLFLSSISESNIKPAPIA